jgi:hypothetical protein
VTLLALALICALFVLPARAASRMTASFSSS